VLDEEDFNFGYEIADGVMRVNHLWLDEKHRGGDAGTFILETLARIAYYEDCEAIEVSIGGGERTEAFLEKRGFHIIETREYSERVKEVSEGDYGVDAVRRVP
jgi:hypothetical protein